MGWYFCTKEVNIMGNEQSVFNKLNAVNVADKVEKKNGLTYLSWAFAWSELKKAYPLATYKVYETAEGCIYWNDGKTAWVKVGVTVDGLEHIEYLPVMDFRNNAIPIEKVTAMDVNKTIQRSTAKAIAMHGLGLSLWTGEDIPELTTSAPAPTKAPAKTPAKAEGDASLIELKKGTENWEKVVKYIEANKGLGIEAIGKQLNRKYKMSPAIKKEIANLFKSESNG